MNLLSILVRDLKTWPVQWGKFCVWAMAEGAPAAWFHTRRPTKVDGGWSDIGTVEHWLGERPDDDCVITMEDWVEAIREVKALNASTAWTGEGLPPVGTVCEHQLFGCEGWSKATVLAYGEKKTFYRDRDGHEWSRLSDEIKFRPIRTAEQIKAEEREKAIDEMLCVDERGSLSRTVFCGLLYDANYRKQVAP